jgi:hypothetical protein
VEDRRGALLTRGVGSAIGCVRKIAPARAPARRGSVARQRVAGRFPAPLGNRKPGFETAVDGRPAKASPLLRVA